MAETFGFFDAEELTDGTFDREYIAEQWANYFKLFVGNGVFATPTNQLKVVAYTGMFVKISIGWAFINGYWYHNDTELEVEIPANMTANTITDGIFIRWDSANREIKATVGVNRTTPNRVAPYYELKLADIVVATGATQITDAEITDTRMDSSVCGIVTGVIEVIDAGNLFAQYQAIFTQWMNSTDTDFDEWRDNQEALYTQWYNAIKAQQTQDLDDFDTWFDAIKGQLSEDAAGHLQNEIDEINAQGLSGSIFTITTTQTELYGKDVTITGANVTKTGKFSAQGVAIITGFTDVGTITITSTDNLETATTVMSIPYFGRYTATLAFWSATVNLEGSESLYGSTITVKDSDNLTVETVTLSILDGTGVFTATAPDTYTFITTYEGETFTWELEVSQEITYNLELSVGFNWQAWLTAGGVDPTDYEDLDEVLEDEKALWKLFTKHSSVDYLADVTSVDDNITKIFNNDLVAKWINLRDYALDTLHANEVLAEVMDDADKYGYGEWIITDDTTTPPTWGPKGNVPVMTANTAPYGEAIKNSEYSYNPAYYAFDDNAQGWSPSNDTTPSYIGYKFTNPICVKRVTFRQAYASEAAISGLKVQGSNDNSTWVDLATFTSESGGATKIVDIPTNSNYYLYYRVYGNMVNSNSYGYKLQFYGRSLSVSIPTMTSATAPYGVVSASTEYSSNNAAWKAFNGALGSGNDWESLASDNNAYIQYTFTSKMKIKQMRVCPGVTSRGLACKQYKLLGSNDGFATSTELFTSAVLTNRTISTGYSWDTYVNDIVSASDYKAYRLAILSTYDTAGYKMITDLQFYGLDYSEKEFEAGTTKKWLYDHGVELTQILLSKGSSAQSAPIKESSEIVCVNGSTENNNNYSKVYVQEDVTPYSLLRMKDGGRITKEEIAASTTNAYPNNGNYDGGAGVVANVSLNDVSAIGPNNYSLDISNVNQSVYLFIGPNWNASRIITITEWWLE